MKNLSKTSLGSLWDGSCFEGVRRSPYETQSHEHTELRRKGREREERVWVKQRERGHVFNFFHMRWSKHVVMCTWGPTTRREEYLELHWSYYMEPISKRTDGTFYKTISIFKLHIFDSATRATLANRMRKVSAAYRWTRVPWGRSRAG